MSKSASRKDRAIWRCRNMLRLPRAGRLCLAAVAMVIIAPFPMSGAGAETLQQALEASYRNNPDINAERSRLRAVKQDVKQAVAGLQPTVSLFGNVGYERSSTRSPTTSTRGAERGAGLRVTQSLFEGFRTVNQIRRAETNVEAGKSYLVNKQQLVLLDVVSAYAAVMRDRALLDLQQKYVVNLGKQVAAARAKMRAGAATLTDVAQAETRQNLAQADAAQAQADLDASAAAYRSLVGFAPGTLTMPVAPRHLLPNSFDQALFVAQRENPIVRATSLEVDAAQYDVNRAVGEMLPTVNVEFTLERTFDDRNAATAIGREDNASVMLRANVPLYQGGAVVSRIQQTREVKGQRQFEADQISNEVRAQLMSSWSQALAAGKRLSASRRQMTTAEAALKGVRIEADAGQRSVLDVLDAERELLLAQINYKRAQHDELVAVYRVVAALGRLTPDRLGLRVAAN